MKKILISLLLLTQSCLADQIDVDYSRFYSHLKKIDKDELNALEFAFGFKKVGESLLCGIKQATIVTQKQSIPLKIDQYQRFTLPIEKALKLANAYITIDLEQPANQCDMSVQLQTKTEYLKTTYSQQELLTLSFQYKQFFSDMGSFLSFMMPSSEGLIFTFAEQAQLLEPVKGFVLNNKDGRISDKAIDQAKEGIKLDSKPIRINALIND